MTDGRALADALVKVLHRRLCAPLAGDGHRCQSCRDDVLALLPVVEAECRRRAAAELRAAADYYAEAFPGEVAVPTSKLRARADAIEAQP